MTSDISETNIPIYVPNNDGDPTLVVGTGRLDGNNLNIELKETVAGEAIRRLLSRGMMMGLNFVVFKEPGVVNEEVQEAKNADQ